MRAALALYLVRWPLAILALVLVALAFCLVALVALPLRHHLVRGWPAVVPSYTAWLAMQGVLPPEALDYAGQTWPERQRLQ